MEPDETQTPFLFDDFFVPEDDPGVEVVIRVRGREVPIMVKRGLTLADREGALSSALKTHVGPDGSLVVDGLDAKKATTDLLLSSIVSWPFTYRDGSPVPVTAETLSRLLAEGVDQLAAVIKDLFTQKQAVVDGPFERA